LVIRVAEDLPLYDILNQFRNGQSHMAVVLKCEENIRTAATEREGKTPGMIMHKQFEFKINHLEAKPRSHYQLSFYAKILGVQYMIFWTLLDIKS